MSNRKELKGVAIALGALWALVASTTLLAQTDVTTTRVSGTVHAPRTARRFPGVTVEVEEPRDRRWSSIATTDGEGFYRLLNLPTGNYTISAALDGFATAEPRGRPAGPRLDADGQLHAAGLGGRRDDHRHRARSPVVEVTNTSELDDDPDRADQEACRSPRATSSNLVAADAADPHRRRARQPLDLRPARHQHQRHRRRRRLQQRLLRRHGGRRRGPRAALDLAGVDQGVLGHHQRRLGRVRPLGRRLRQRHHEERHQQPARLGLLLQRSRRA